MGTFPLINLPLSSIPRLLIVFFPYPTRPYFSPTPFPLYPTLFIVWASIYPSLTYPYPPLASPSPSLYCFSYPSHLFLSYSIHSSFPSFTYNLPLISHPFFVIHYSQFTALFPYSFLPFFPSLTVLQSPLTAILFSLTTSLPPL